MIRVLLYGDVDLNLIDGSAIWLASLAEVLGGIPGVSVSVLQKTPLTRDLVTRSAASLPSVTFLDPWMLARENPKTSEALSNSPNGRLSPQAAAALIQILDQEQPYSLVLVRSIEAASILADTHDIARRLWAYVTDPLRYTEPSECANLRHIAERCNKVVCQTEEAKSAFLVQVGIDATEKVILLPPMIPALVSDTRPSVAPSAPRLGYSGKFSPPYMILEMLDAFELIRRRCSDAEFHVVGDKFHNMPPVEGFVDAVTSRLTSTPGVIWHGGVSRAEANEILKQADFASSWRAPTFDDSVEMSTKILEYSALGIPVLMNPSPIQKRFFGPEYPAYVTNETDFVNRVLTLADSPMLYERAAQVVQKTASDFTYESHRHRLQPLLLNSESRIRVMQRTPTILWVGHDFKFLRLIRELVEQKGPYRGLTDEHEGHVIRHPERSRELIRQADLIFCEWCLGNAEWYSKHKQPDQPLVIRLHHQEIELPYLERIQWENVNCIIFICPRNMQRFLDRFPAMVSKTRLIYNAIDCAAYGLPKLERAEFNLGMLGIAPKRKAPHLALEIFARLKNLDSRYTLCIKSHHPSEYGWLWRKPSERSYYERLYNSVDSAPYANSIVFDRHGDDVADWFTKIGFILSTSDHEGSHQAVAEGMAAGSIPIIRNWAGAAELYPTKYIFSTTEQAVDSVQRWNVPAHYAAETEFCQDWAQRFDLAEIVSLLGNLFAETLSSCSATAGCPATRAAPIPQSQPKNDNQHLLPRSRGSRQQPRHLL